MKHTGARLTKPPFLSGSRKDLLQTAEAERFVQEGRIEPLQPSATPSVGAPVASAAEPLPWEDADARFKQSVMIKVPEQEYLMLKWLAGTTYGASQTSMILEAMREYMTPRLEAKGLVVMHNEDGTLKVVRKPT